VNKEQGEIADDLQGTDVEDQDEKDEEK